MKHKKKEFGLILFMSLVYLFLYMPIFVIIMYSFNRSGDNLTFQGFTLHWYKEVFGGDPLFSNLWLSIKLAVVSTVISCMLGIFATIGTYRYEFKLKKYI